MATQNEMNLQEFAKQMLVEIKKDQEWLTGQKEVLGEIQARTDECLKKVKECDMAKGVYSATQMANELGVSSAQKLYDKLKDESGNVLRLRNDASWMSQVKETKDWVENFQKEIERQKKTFVPFETVDDVLECAEYARNVLNAKGVSYTTTQVAKELGMHSGRLLNEELRQAGIIYKQNNDWLLKSKYEGYDLTTSRTIRQGNKNYSRMLMWTERGRMWLHNLKKRGGVILTEPKPIPKEEPKIVSLKSTETLDSQRLNEEIQCLLNLVSSIGENETLNSKEILLVDIMDISTTIQRAYHFYREGFMFINQWWL